MSTFVDEASFYVAMIIYFIDIIVNLRTAYYNDLGKEVRDPRLISH